MAIRPERWPHLSALLDQALELPEGQRAAWMAGLKLDSDDADSLRQLLAAVAGGPTWIDRVGPAVSASELAVGDKVGPFRITGMLGRGGMGVVYAASRDVQDLCQHVALKLLPASLDSVERHRRFLEERRLLARLEHPGIARLIDSGIADNGQPWFAMERVYGIPIDRYCSERKLGLRACLRLLVDVCDAVQYAHGQLIVHRDIKPSNILVDQDGRVRLLDFGIAKAIDDGEQTHTQWRALTPAYAAPEQILGEPASVSADVWSLGVLLYTLIVGDTPFADARAASGSNVSELRAVLEREVMAPSGMTPSDRPISAAGVRGDIDAIVLRALAKEPRRRYGSVDALASDIRRHLAFQPVQARRGVWSYRIGRFLRRYQLPVAIAAVAVAALAGTVLYALSEARRAQIEAARATQTKEFLLSLFELGDPDASGRAAITASTLLRLGGDRAISAFAGSPALRSELVRSIAALSAKLGDHDYGVRSLDSVLNDGDAAALPRHDRVALLLDRAELLLRDGRIERARADLHAAGALLAQADDQAGRRRLLLVQAGIDEAEGRFDAAEEAIDQALVLDRAREGGHGAAVAHDLYALGNLQQVRGDLVAAQDTLRQVRVIELERLGARHTRLAQIDNDLGVIAAMRGQHEEAAEYHQRALALRESLLGANHPLVAQSLRNWGGSERQRGHLDQAGSMYRRALDILLATWGPDHPETGLAHNALAVLSFGRGDMTAARAHLLDALAVFRQQPGSPPMLANLELNLAGIDARSGDWQAAHDGYEAALLRLLELYGEDHVLVAAALSGRASMAILRGEPERASVDLDWIEAIHARVYTGDHLDRWLVAASRARCLILLGRHGQAAAIVATLRPKLEATLPPDHLHRQELELIQAELELANGDFDAARQRTSAVLEQRWVMRDRYPYGVADAALALARIESARGRRAAAFDLVRQSDAVFPPDRLPATRAALRARLVAAGD